MTYYILKSATNLVQSQKNSWLWERICVQSWRDDFTQAMVKYFELFKGLFWMYACGPFQNMTSFSWKSLPAAFVLFRIQIPVFWEALWCVLLSVLCVSFPFITEIPRYQTRDPQYRHWRPETLSSKLWQHHLPGLPIPRAKHSILGVKFLNPPALKFSEASLCLFHAPGYHCVGHVPPNHLDILPRVVFRIHSEPGTVWKHILPDKSLMSNVLYADMWSLINNSKLKHALLKIHA